MEGVTKPGGIDEPPVTGGFAAAGHPRSRRTHSAPLSPARITQLCDPVVIGADRPTLIAQIRELALASGRAQPPLYSTRELGEEMFYRDQRGRVLAHPPADPAEVESPSLVLPPGLNLLSYHAVLISISGGADSWLAAAMTVQAAREAGMVERVRTVFADLGEDDEWPRTRELAAELLCTMSSRSWRLQPDRTSSASRASGAITGCAGGSVG